MTDDKDTESRKKPATDTGTVADTKPDNGDAQADKGKKHDPWLKVPPVEE